jgi:hypothetical protein
VRDAPEVARFLVERGAWFDIFIAIGLRDLALVERCLREDPEALDHRIWHGKYRVAHNGARPATVEEIGDRRGDTYRWVFGHNLSAIDVARSLGYQEIVERLLRDASPAQRLLAACAAADRGAAEAVVAAHPDLVRSLTPAQMQLITDAAHADRTAAVLLMIDLGFDPHARGVDGWEPIRWAAFHGNVELVRRLLAYDPPLRVPDPSYGGTPVEQCLYGSVHGWSCKSGDFAAATRLLLDAGDTFPPDDYPTGRDDVDAVLREHLARRT